ncbi:hypothetical protein GE09DRAFT_1152222 [Coniochaeta sp. 2T2.1]|nr:hypothetical protein GE09DRAFT_1152222 [Coniochaeta sp. 2T2.1]
MLCVTLTLAVISYHWPSTFADMSDVLNRFLQCPITLPYGLLGSFPGVGSYDISTLTRPEVCSDSCENSSVKSGQRWLIFLPFWDLNLSNPIQREIQDKYSFT